MPIIFTPREVKDYSEDVPFELNGLYTVNVTVAGEVCNGFSFSFTPFIFFFWSIPSLLTVDIHPF